MCPRTRRINSDIRAESFTAKAWIVVVVVVGGGGGGDWRGEGEYL
jgi:hypothetical protein